MSEIEIIDGKAYHIFDKKTQLPASRVKRIVSLLRCPFCGEDPEIMILDDVGQIAITCENDECKTEDVWVTGDTGKEVVNNWNTRVGMTVSDLDRPDLFAEILSSLAMLSRCGDMQQKNAKETVKAVDMLKMHMGFLKG